MAKQFSFTKYEREVLPEFRKRVNLAETAEEIRNVFFQAVRSLFDVFLAGDPPCEPLDIVLREETAPHFQLSARLRGQANFKKVWANSDLPKVVERMAAAAVHRCRHLGLHCEKTDAKIRQQTGGGPARQG